MGVIDKIKGGLMTAFATGSAAVFGSTTAHAEGELSAVTTSVNSSITEIVNVITPIAWTAVILVIVIIGCILLWGGEKAKEKVKSHIVAIVIGCVLIAGASVIAKWWTSTLDGNFNNG